MRLNRLAPIILFLIFLITMPIYVSNTYVLHLFMLFFIASVLGMGFSMLYSTGLISLGAAAFYAIGAYSSTLFTLKLGLSFWASLPLAIIFTAVTACIFGMIFIRTSNVAFVVFTLLFGMMIYNMLGSVEFFGGWGGFVNIPKPTPIPLPFGGEINFDNRASYYYMGLFLALIIILALYALYTSRIGRAWKVIKQSTRLAESLGINIFRYRLLAFVIASTAAGAMGAFYSHYYQVIVPAMFGGFLSIYIQVYSALGGLEFYILGPIIGAFIMIFVPQWIRIDEAFIPVVFGAIIILIIVFFPGGILGSIFQTPKPLLYTKIEDKIKGWFAFKLKSKQ